MCANYVINNVKRRIFKDYVSNFDNLSSNIYCTYISVVKFFTRLFRFYIDASIHVALAVFSLIKLTYIKYTIFNEWIYSGLIFSLTIVAYNYAKYFHLIISGRFRHHAYLRYIIYFTMVCFIVALFLFFIYGLAYFVLLLPVMIATIFYVTPLQLFHKNLRSFAGLKIFIVAVIWSYVSVYIPLFHFSGTLNKVFLIEAIQRFLIVLVLILPFEIRDLRNDDRMLQTIPQQVGVFYTKILGSFLGMGFLILEIFKSDFTSIEWSTTLVVGALAMGFLWKSRVDQSKFYASFWVESIPVIWFVIYILLINL